MATRFLPPIIYREQFSQILFTIRKVASLLWRVNPRLTFLIFVVSASWGLLTFPAFYLEKLILDRIVANIGNPAWRQVLFPISLLITARVLIETTRIVLSSLQSFLRYFASRTFNMRIDVMMGSKLAKLDAKTLEDPGFQDRFNKIERESGRRAWGLMMPLADIPNHLTGFISSVGILWFLHPLVALGVVAVSIPLVWVDRGFIKREYEFQEKISPQYRIWGWLNYYLVKTKNFLELRLLRLANYFTKWLEGVQDQILSGELALYTQKEKFRALAYFPGLFFYILVNIYLVVLTIGKRITVGSYEMFLRALLAAAQNFSGLMNSFLEIYENYIFVQDFVWFLNLKPQISLPKGVKKLAKIKRTIEFADVWFKYKEDGEWVLKVINVTFAPGEKVAIVGENGAGKSTLIKLLARFYDPQKGKVLVDGKDVKKLNLGSYQQKFAILFQNFETYPFSAQETIGYGDVTRLGKLDLIQKAATRTGIHDYIEELPLKYQNPLSPRLPKGVEPSMGQWQRFGISRMLFRRDAEILILDEPTSNVDPEAEERIFNELLKLSKSKILIFVSQRFSTVRRADRILVVDKGRIIERGTHKELMEVGGKYARLFNLQAKGYR